MTSRDDDGCTQESEEMQNPAPQPSTALTTDLVAEMRSELLIAEKSVEALQSFDAQYPTFPWPDMKGSFYYLLSKPDRYSTATMVESGDFRVWNFQGPYIELLALLVSHFFNFALFYGTSFLRAPGDGSYWFIAGFIGLFSIGLTIALTIALRNSIFDETRPQEFPLFNLTRCFAVVIAVGFPFTSLCSFFLFGFKVAQPTEPDPMPATGDPFQSDRDFYTAVNYILLLALPYSVLVLALWVSGKKFMEDSVSPSIIALRTLSPMQSLFPYPDLKYPWPVKLAAYIRLQPLVVGSVTLGLVAFWTMIRVAAGPNSIPAFIPCLTAFLGFLVMLHKVLTWTDVYLQYKRRESFGSFAVFSSYFCLLVGLFMGLPMWASSAPTAVVVFFFGGMLLLVLAPGAILWVVAVRCIVKSRSLQKKIDGIVAQQPRTGIRPDESKKAARRQGTCGTCGDRQATIILVPCGHVALCHICPADKGVCPICQRRVDGSHPLRYV